MIGLGLVAERQGLSFKNPETRRNADFLADIHLNAG